MGNLSGRVGRPRVLGETDQVCGLVKRRAQKLAKALRKLGYSVTLTEIHPQPVAEASA